MQEGSILAAKFRLVSLLGRGGMGDVWRADHLALRAPVVVKLMSVNIASSPEALARFHREAQSAANLRSPHVVQILDHGVDEATNTPFIVMELLEGESLAARLARFQKLAPGETARHITHVARALARAHEIGIVHRDLKPDNVFIVHNDDDEVTKVLDFGIAKWETSPHPAAATHTGTTLGTPFYMSPEQFSDAKDIDHRTDLWALGVIACQCLTGRRPFQGDSIVALGLLICGGPRILASSLGPVPPGFDAWFARATARDREQRFQSARELAEGLRSLCVESNHALGSEAPGRGATRGSEGEGLDGVRGASGWDPGGSVTPPFAPAPRGVSSAAREDTALYVESVGPLSRTAPSDPVPNPPRRPSGGWLVAGALVLLGVVATAVLVLSAGPRVEAQRSQGVALPTPSAPEAPRHAPAEDVSHEPHVVEAVMGGVAAPTAPVTPIVSVVPPRVAPSTEPSVATQAEPVPPTIGTVPPARHARVEPLPPRASSDVKRSPAEPTRPNEATAGAGGRSHTAVPGGLMDSRK
jgi:eukaryotic-like serine/threonine-protein kinase